MKKVSVFFSLVVVGIVFSFGMSIYEAVRENQEKKSAQQSDEVPVPAIAQ